MLLKIISPANILSNVVFAISLSPIKIALSFGFIVNDTLSNTFSPSIVSKSKQATSRKKQLEKIELDDIQPSSRRYPFVKFTPEREIGNDLLIVQNLSKTIDGEKVLDIFSSCFLRLVACLDLEALAEKRAIKSCNSFIFSSFFLFVSSKDGSRTKQEKRRKNERVTRLYCSFLS
jgi:hypothetical protein